MLFSHFTIRYQGDVAERFRLFRTTFVKTGFGEEEEVCLFIVEQIAAFDQRFQQTEVDFFRSSTCTRLKAPSYYPANIVKYDLANHT